MIYYAEMKAARGAMALEACNCIASSFMVGCCIIVLTQFSHLIVIINLIIVDVGKVKKEKEDYNL